MKLCRAIQRNSLPFFLFNNSNNSLSSSSFSGLAFSTTSSFSPKNWHRSPPNWASFPIYSHTVPQIGYSSQLEVSSEIFNPLQSLNFKINNASTNLRSTINQQNINNTKNENVSTKTTSEDSEIKNANMIFNTVWDKLVKKRGKENIRFPKEIIWLTGAPGSGKTTHTPFIAKSRGITTAPIVMSDLLTSPEANKLKGEGILVSDQMVVEILFEALLNPIYQVGVIVDGFPRTEVQVECIKLLSNKMFDLRKEFIGTPLGPFFRRPAFRVCVLFVNQNESMTRQRNRAIKVLEENKKAEENGFGTKSKPRDTDIDERKLEQRYLIFKQHFSTLERLREHFAFSLIDASGNVPDVEKKIRKEFQYQSTLELGEDTYDSIMTVPLVTDIQKNARQELVRRLDHYMTYNKDLFNISLDIIKQQLMPSIKRHANVGSVVIRVKSRELEKNQACIDMILDIMTERGYYISFEEIEEKLPLSIDRETFRLVYEHNTLFKFTISFQRNNLRSNDAGEL
jgi:adenylate kinase